MWLRHVTFVSREKVKCFVPGRMFGTKDNSWLSRVNDQVNYKRHFLSPSHVQVTIPTLPYHAFDLFHSGKLVQPWDIINLVVSARLFTQYPAKNTVTGQPDQSIVDTHSLMKDHLLFIVGLKLDVSRAFYNLELPKYPLTVDVSATHVGSSSTRRAYKLFHESLKETPFFNCEIDDVMVDKITRQSAKFPTWWEEKYGYLKTSKSRINIPSPTENDVMFSDKFLIEFEHIDHNGHTTTSAYVKFCYNAAYRNMTKSNYPCANMDHLKAGTRSLLILFLGESSPGDTLTVESWERTNNPGQLYFQFKKETGEKCCSISILFHDICNETNDVSKSRL